MNKSSNFLLPNYDEILNIQRQIQINEPSNQDFQATPSDLIQGLSILCKSLFHYFTQPLALWYLLLSILHQVLSIPPDLPIILILFLSSFIDLLQNLLVEFPEFLSRIENKKSTVLVWTENKFVKIQKKNLNAGQILLIKQNEIVPADVLIIANGNFDRVSYFDVAKVTGQNEMQKKVAVKQIQALIDSNEVNDAGFYLNTIEGTLVLMAPCKDFSVISGKVKLRSDPKSIKINLSSVALEGSVLKFSPWVFALVLYSGVETKIEQNRKKIKKVESKTGKILRFVVKIWIFIVVLLSLLNSLLSLATKRGLDRRDFFYNLTLYTFFLPLALLFMFDLSNLIQCIIIKFYMPGLQLSYSSVLESLGQVDYVVFSRSGLIQSTVPKVRSLMIEYNLYMIDQDVRTESSEATNLLVTESDSAMESLRRNIEDNKLEYFNFIRAMALCTRYYTQGPEQDLTLAGEDSALVSLASDIGLSVIHRDSKRLVLSHNSIDHEYRIVAHRSSSESSKKLRVLLENIKTREFIYYVRGTFESLSDLASSQVTRNIEKLWLTDPGIRILAFGTLNLSLKQVEKFLHNYSSARKTPINKEGRIQALFEEFDTKVTWLGFAGLEDKLLKCDIEAVNSFKQAGIKLWISSADSEEWTYSCGLCSEVIEKDYEIVRVPQADSCDELICLLQDSIKHYIFMDNFRLSSNVSNSSEGSEKQEGESRKSLAGKQRESLMSLQSLRRTSLHPLITHISNKPCSDFSVSKPYSSDLSTFVLILNGKILDLAFKSSESLKLLSLMMFVAKSVCCYEMLPDHYQLLDKILANCLSFDPVVLGVGGAGVGIRCDIDTALNQSQEKEIKTRTLNDLKHLVLNVGINFYVKRCRILKLAVFINCLLGSVLCMHCYFSGFGNLNVLSDSRTYLFVFGLQVLVYFNQAFAESAIEFDLIGPFRQVYLTGTLDQELSANGLLGFSFIGVVMGLISYFLMILTFMLGVDHEGHSYSYLEIEFYLLIILSATLQSCMLIDSTKISLRTLIYQTLAALFLILYLIILKSLNSEDSSSLAHLFHSPSPILSLILNVALNSSIYYSRLRWKELFSPSLLDHYRSAKAYFSVLDFKSRQNEYEENLDKVYKPNSLAYTSESTLENPLDKCQLIFKSESKEQEYNKEKFSTYKRSYRFNFIFYLVLYSGLFLYTSIAKESNHWHRGLLIFSFCFAFLSIFLVVSPLYSIYTLHLISFLYISGVFSSIISIIIQYDTFSTSFSLYPLLFIVPCTHWLRFTCPVSLLLLILDIYFKSYTFSTSSESSHSSYLLCEYAFLIFSILGVSVSCSYLLDYHKRQEFLLVSQVSVKTSKANDVLRLLLPSFVINKVKTGIYYISIDQGVVSVLFCNICNFEELTSDLTPPELTGFLDELYGKFDQLCEILGVTKIETVGKTYMASAGIKDSEMELDSYLSSISHARRLVELALGMIRIVQKTHLKGARVNIKIGVNSGPVRAGVVGYHKPQFSLVGDTVNIASRMASTLSEYDSIQITQDTYEIIKESQELAFCPQTSFVKGKGEMNTFIVKLAQVPETLSSEISASGGDTYGSGFKPPYLSCKVSASHLSLSAAYSGDQVIRSSFTRKSKVSAQWKRKNTIQSKSSKVISKARLFPCSIKDRKKEEKFRLLNAEKKVKNFYISVIFTLICYSGLLVSELIFISHHSLHFTIQIGLSLSVILSNLCLLPLIKPYYKSKCFGWVHSLLLCLPALIIILSDIYDTKSSYTITSLHVSFQVLLLTQCSALQYTYQSFLTLLVFLLYMIYTCIHPSHPSFITLVFLLLSQISSYTTEIKLRIYSKLQSSSQKELTKLEDLLTQMVPPHAYEHLKAENSVIDKFFQVTLLYADIVGFTAWSSNRKPEEVVRMLNEMFTRFDQMCVSHSVYKVHTIGDCYVAMGNAGSSGRDVGQECVNVLKFAHAMIDTIRLVNDEYKMGISMRIGVHTGDVVAGIMGKSIVRYDIYGNDVYIANSMESNGIAGQVAVSKTTMNLVRSLRPTLMNFESYKKVEVFGEEIEVFLAKFN